MVVGVFRSDQQVLFKLSFPIHIGSGDVRWRRVCSRHVQMISLVTLLVVMAGVAEVVVVGLRSSMH